MLDSKKFEDWGGRGEGGSEEEGGLKIWLILFGVVESVPHCMPWTIKSESCYFLTVHKYLVNFLNFLSTIGFCLTCNLICLNVVMKYFFISCWCCPLVLLVLITNHFLKILTKSSVTLYWLEEMSRKCKLHTRIYCLDSLLLVYKISETLKENHRNSLWKNDLGIWFCSSTYEDWMIQLNIFFMLK